MDQQTRNFRSIREQLKLTRTEVARRAGVNRAYYSRIENGKQRNVLLSTYEKLAAALNCSVKDLIADDSN